MILKNIIKKRGVLKFNVELMKSKLWVKLYILLILLLQLPKVQMLQQCQLFLGSSMCMWYCVLRSMQIIIPTK
jgi:hypothetical protein